MPLMKTMFSLRHAEVGHLLLGLGEDRVVAAAGAPADLLVGHEVLPGQLDDLGVLGAEAAGPSVVRRRRWRDGSVSRGLLSARIARPGHDLGDRNGLPRTWL